MHGRALRAGLGALAVLLMAWEVHRQHQRLRQAGMDTVLLARLARLDNVAALGILLLLGSAVLKS